MLAVIITRGSGLGSGGSFNWGRLGDSSDTAGVCGVVTDVDNRDSGAVGSSSGGADVGIEGTDHTVDDITQVAFGQIGSAEAKGIGIRYSDDDVQDGVYAVDGTTITVKLLPKTIPLRPGLPVGSGHPDQSLMTAPRLAWSQRPKSLENSPFFFGLVSSAGLSSADFVSVGLSSTASLGRPSPAGAAAVSAGA